MTTSSDLLFTKYPYSAAMQAEVIPHCAAIATFRSLIQPLASRYPDSYPLTQCLQDDRACYRWLKARHFSPQQALNMITQALQYREEHELDSILQRPFPKAEAIHRLSQDSLHGYDRDGRPIMVSRFGLVDMAGICALSSDEERVDYHHYMSEYLHRIVLPAASARKGVLVDTFSCLFDMAGFSTAIITKQNYAYVSATIRVNSLLYPEAMGQCLILNAPWVFSIGWNMVKAAIDDVTRSKIVIVRGLGQVAVSALIDGAQLPHFVGGSCRCDGHDGGCMSGNEVDRGFVSWVRQHADGCPAGCEETVVRKGSDGSDGLDADLYSDSDEQQSAELSRHLVSPSSA